MCEPDNSPKEEVKNQVNKNKTFIDNEVDEQAPFSGSYLVIVQRETQLTLVRSQMVLHEVRVLVDVYGL